MSTVDTLGAPVAALMGEVIPGSEADSARLELARIETAREIAALKMQLATIAAGAECADPWTSRARPTFLYVMYVLFLWALPMGLIAAVQPQMAANISRGMTAYLSALPEPLYALFGTGYLGYTAARQWGKVKGLDK